MEEVWAAVAAALVLATACSSSEASAADLAARGAANLRSAQTTHVDGSGSLSVKGDFAQSFVLRVSGDAQAPDRARMRVQVATSGAAIDLETITVGDRSYVKDSATGKWSDGSSSSLGMGLDPFGTTDLAAIRDIAEVDRPLLDGRQTRHLRYSTDGAKLIAAMRGAAPSAAGTVANVRGSGELWIRIDDTQIVRQLVIVSFDVDGVSKLGSVETTRTSVKMSMDMRFSRHGQPVPAITAPPLH